MALNLPMRTRSEAHGLTACGIDHGAIGDPKTDLSCKKRMGPTSIGLHIAGGLSSRVSTVIQDRYTQVAEY